MQVGCRQRVCYCHDQRGWEYPDSFPVGCSSCGCHRASVEEQFADILGNASLMHWESVVAWEHSREERS